MTMPFSKTYRSSLRKQIAGLSVACLLVGTAVVAATHKGLPQVKAPDSKTPVSKASKLGLAEINQTMGKMPLAFEPNRGQTDSRVQYLARARGYMALLAGNENLLRIKPTGEGTGEGALAVKLQNANSAPRAVASDEQVSKSNYLIGNDRSKWLTDLPNYGKVTYRDVYAGIDLVYSGNDRNLEYDFVVKPGADPNQIRVAYWGSSRFELSAQGDLELETAAGRTLAHKPVVYQTVHGRRQPVQGEYVLTAKNEVGFKLGAYDASQPLVIDPTVTVLTALAGAGVDAGNAVAANATGVYLTGSTNSAPAATTGGNGFPLTPGLCSTGGATTVSGCATQVPVLGTFTPPSFPTMGTYNGATYSGTAGTPNAFVMKLSANGTQLLYSTYLGGSGNVNGDVGRAIAVDSSGAAYLTGDTVSSNFPVTNGSQLSGAQNLFITKVAANGQSLVYSTYFGGSGTDSGRAIAVDANGNAYVGGFTSSSNIRMTNPLTATATSCVAGPPATSNCSSAFTGSTNQGSNDALIIKLDPNANILFSSFVGGTGDDRALGIAVDSTGAIYAAGTTASLSGINNAASFPTTRSSCAGANCTFDNFMATGATAGTASFVTKVTLNASNVPTVAWSDTIGVNAAVTTTANQTIQGIAVDSSGRAIVVGQTKEGATPGFSLTNGQLGATAATPTAITGTTNACTPVGATTLITNIRCTTPTAASSNQGYAIALDASGKFASYINYIETAVLTATSPDTTLNGVAVDDAGQAYIAGTQAVSATVDNIYLARLNAAGALNSSPTPGALNFTAVIAGLDTAPAATNDKGNGIAVIPAASGIRTAFVIGTDNPTGVVQLSKLAATGAAGVLSSASATPQQALLRGPNSSTLNPSTIPFPPATPKTAAGMGSTDIDFATLTFQDLTTSNTTLTFSTTPGGGAPPAQTIAVTGIGSASAPCPLALGTGATANTPAPTGPSTLIGTANGSGTSFFAAFNGGAAGTVAATAGTNNQFTVTPPAANATATAGVQTSGSFTITSGGGVCPFLEPLTVGVIENASTGYSASPTSIPTITTQLGVTPTSTPTFTLATQSGTVNTNVTVGTINVTCVPFTLGSTGGGGSTVIPNGLNFGSLANNNTATITLTPASCIGSITTPNTYTGNITIAPAAGNTGAASSATVGFTIIVTPALQISATSPSQAVTLPATTVGPLVFTFTAGATSSQQGSFTLSAVGAAFNYATSVTNGTFPAGALTVASNGSGTVSAGGTQTVGLNVNPTGLAPGQYTGKVLATSGTQTLTVNVTANVGNAFVPTFQATGAAAFTPVTSAGLVLSLPQNVSTSVGTLNLNSITTANVTGPTITYTGTATGWLSTPSTCASVSSTLTCSMVLTANTTGLAANNSYSANIGFTSTTTGVAALTIPVTLSVTTGPTFLESVGVPVPTLSTTVTPLIFRGAPGATITQQQLNLGLNASTVTSATITPATTSGGNWLAICAGALTPGCTPASTALTGQSLSTTSSPFSVGVSSTNLTPGKTYTGTITVSAANTTSMVIPVSLIVLPANPTGVGIYRSANGLFIENSLFNNSFTQADTVTSFSGNGLTAQPGDIPVTGDWSGTGTTKIGIYRPSTGTWFLDYNGNGVFDGPTVDRQFQYGGLAGDIPVVGDWNGTGFAKVGIFRAGFQWLLNVNGSGVFGTTDAVFAFGGLTGCTAGLPGAFASEPTGSCDVPIVGDWNQSGFTKVGVVRAAPGTNQPFLWILDTTGAHTTTTVFAFGGLPGDIPVVGDWLNTGNVQVGVFRGSPQQFFWVEDTTANMPTPPAASDTLVGFAYGGLTGDLPIVGRWR